MWIETLDQLELQWHIGDVADRQILRHCGRSSLILCTFSVTGTLFPNGHEKGSGRTESEMKEKDVFWTVWANWHVHIHTQREGLAGRVTAQLQPPGLLDFLGAPQGTEAIG